jgi:SHS2 domain-containing protein
MSAGSYRFVEDVTVADVAFEARADNLGDLFAACGRATFDVMVDLDHVKPRESIVVQLTNETLDGLLFDWLDELIGKKDIDALVFSEFQVSVDQVDAGFSLKATVRGEPISAELPMRLDVKAPTAHRLEVARVDGGWRAHVVLDV